MRRNVTSTRRKTFQIQLMLTGASLLLAHGQAFAHGEDKPGPHGGIILMPGVFHTEIVPESTRTFLVYLLDENWKNPSTGKSSLSVRFGKRGELAKCQPVGSTHYSCAFSPKIDLNRKGSLLVKATRNGRKGAEVTYELPLRPLGAGHSGH